MLDTINFFNTLNRMDVLLRRAYEASKYKGGLPFNDQWRLDEMYTPTPPSVNPVTTTLTLDAIRNKYVEFLKKISDGSPEDEEAIKYKIDLLYYQVKKLRDLTSLAKQGSVLDAEKIFVRLNSALNIQLSEEMKFIEEHIDEVDNPNAAKPKAERPSSEQLLEKERQRRIQIEQARKDSFKDLQEQFARKTKTSIFRALEAKDQALAQELKDKDEKRKKDEEETEAIISKRMQEQIDDPKLEFLSPGEIIQKHTLQKMRNAMNDAHMLLKEQREDARLRALEPKATRPASAVSVQQNRNRNARIQKFIGKFNEPNSKLPDQAQVSQAHLGFLQNQRNAGLSRGARILINATPAKYRNNSMGGRRITRRKSRSKKHRKSRSR